MTSRVCGCVEGYLRNSTDNVCYPDPTWCKTAADCADKEVCCSFAPCDGPNMQRCVKTLEACSKNPACATGGVVVGEERMQADEAKKNETSSSEEERSRENGRNQQRRRQKKKGRNNWIRVKKYKRSCLKELQLKLSCCYALYRLIDPLGFNKSKLLLD